MASQFYDDKGQVIPEAQILGSGTSQSSIDSATEPSRFLCDTHSTTMEDTTTEPDFCSTSDGGNLREYVEQNRSQPPPHILLPWFRQMALAISQAHKNHVLVGDISSSNFLLEADNTLKMCGFSHAIIIEPGEDMDTVEKFGRSVQTDIGELGAVIYELITGREIKYDLNKGVVENEIRLPFRQNPNLPDTDGIWCGSVIRKCWTGQFKNMEELVRELNPRPLGLRENGQPGARQGITGAMRRTCEAIEDAAATIVIAAFFGVAMWQYRRAWGDL
ncbi:kinase-like domain-containing protein [Aspergillus undulatus]|uniref:kinase-like domain-containing protein n=1 Tax=Aspergillus undulatus TaxID=1810928 RepID=UPI003CCD7AFF